MPDSFIACSRGWGTDWLGAQPRAFPEAISASSRGGHPNLRQLGDGLREGRGRGLSRREIFLRWYNCDIISIMIVVLSCACCPLRPSSLLSIGELLLYPAPEIYRQAAIYAIYTHSDVT